MKKKIIWKIIKNFFLAAILFVLLLMLRSSTWFLDNFSGVAFSTVVYQLFSPMKGTGVDILREYCDFCLFPVIHFSIFFFVLYSGYDILMEKLIFEFDIQIGKKAFCIKIGNKFRRFSECAVLGLACLGFGIIIWKHAVLIGIPEYIQDITDASQIYEEEYIDPENIRITFPEKKRNLLFIYMESMETTYASVIEGGGKSVDCIPELTELAIGNTSFSNDSDLGGAFSCADTGWTMGGLLASSSGVNYKLPIQGNEAGNYEKFLPGLITLGDILEKSGYQNYFMCGSDATFAGKSDFFIQHGNYQIFEYDTAIEKGIIPEDYHVFWGMEDKCLYEYAKQELTQIAENNEPFNFTMLTVDTHHPDGYVCELCGSEYDRPFENVLACASRQVSQFIAWAEEQDWYDNTTIVIIGDHLSMKSDFWDDIGDYERKIYNCFINLPDGLSAYQIQNREFTILDMFPTVLTSLDVKIEGERLGLGTNLFSEMQTLPEQMGKDSFNEELRRYSDYYQVHFVISEER